MIDSDDEELFSIAEGRPLGTYFYPKRGSAHLSVRFLQSSRRFVERSQSDVTIQRTFTFVGTARRGRSSGGGGG